MLVVAAVASWLVVGIVGLAMLIGVSLKIVDKPNTMPTPTATPTAGETETYVK